MPHAHGAARDGCALAIDLGAESGRAMLGRLDDGRLALEEVHRFPTGQVAMPAGPVWDIGGIFGHILEGIRRGADRARTLARPLATVGVDSWGVDFGLVGRSGALLGLPHCYRDGRCDEPYRRALAQLGRPAIYEATGTQFMAINALYRLMVHRESEPETTASAQHLLFIADLFHYLLCGQPSNEATLASTSQMYDPRTGAWATDLLRSLDLPTSALGAITAAGTPLGSLRAELVTMLGLDEAPLVVTPAAHDTACAVAAVPAEPDAAWAFLSSGTWSCLGAELDAPMITDAAREAGFTNEEGVGRTIRFLTNIIGLWLVQEIRHALDRDGATHDYPELAALAEDAEPFRTLFDTSHPPFASPGDMPAKIAAYARATGQPVPETPGQLVRASLESLALDYRLRLDALEGVLDRRIEVLHIVGGGGRNELLNRMAAGAIARPVLVGPFEATATGNVLVQMMASGAVADLAHLRSVVRASAEPQSFMPADQDRWASALERRRVLPRSP